ncbi:hypothetical protein GCM10010399_38440 [Dactylosporangium fulvum]|uniref:DUF3352 domain-containing protein n=1 Tax=Dactylosporangium fulvum TaxID=53359 RepID=A0ABY5W206_9ACTN|nr:hypothetical protein [Dactylosporangium fulvum]UWP84083.1 hypothetical protein Dfulv_07480 [Dactylosporangium fulvum]
MTTSDDPLPSGDTPQEQQLTAVPTPSRRRLAGVLTAVGVTLAVIAAGGAFAVVRLWKDSTGTLPESAVPGSVVAFARVNLSPGLGQRLKFESLLGNGAQQLDDMKRKVFEDLEAPISYGDVAPWFDDRIGLALWADPARPDDPVTLVAAAAKDADKASKALTTAQQKSGTDRLGFVVDNGYALLAVGEKGSQAAATAAAAATKRGSLAQASAFTSAVATLPPDQPLLGWADLEPAGKLSQKLGEDLAEEFLGGGIIGEETGPLPSASPLPEVKGIVVVGAQAVDNAVEVRGRLIGASGVTIGSPAPATDVVQAIGGLSADAIAAGVLSGPLNDLTTVLGEDLGYLPLTLFGQTLFPEGPAGEIPPELMSDDPAVFEKYLKEHPELLENGGSFAFAGPPGAPADLDKSTKALTAGLSSAKTLSFTVAGKVDEKTGGVPLLVDVELPDAAAAKKLQGDLTNLTELTGATCEQRDAHVSLRSKSYSGGTGKLADSPLFKQAMTGGVAKPSAALYLDGKQAFSKSGPVRAIGVTTGHDGADTVFQARIVIK